MIFENIKLAFFSIRANKMRSFLTMLGMIIGISSVIAIVSLGDTMRGVVAKEYQNVGVGLGQAYISSENDYYTENEMFSVEDAQRLKEGLKEDITYVGFQSTSRSDLTAGRKKESVVIRGLAENPSAFKKLKIVYGRMLKNKDIREKRNFIILDKSTAYNIFGKEDAVGKTIKTTINEQAVDLVVVGIFENTDSAMMKLMMGGSFASAYVPESIMTSDSSSNWSITFIMNENGDIARTQAKVQSYIARMKNQNIKNVNVMSAQQEMGSIDTMLKSLSAVVGAIAAISLVVGGIGIMNIMLVSVTERTREIGIRKALGARTKDIMIQFLIEAAAISAAGGIIGTTLGISAVAAGAMAFGVSAVVKPSVVILAVAFSAVVGLGFGMYPARKAAKKDPVEALRYE